MALELDRLFIIKENCESDETSPVGVADMISPYTYTIYDYLQQLSSSKPTPGGGSTSAVVASLGSAIAIMAARISDRSETQEEIQHLVQRFISFLDRFEQLCQEDMDSFQHVMNCLKSKGDDNHLQQSIEQAAAVPLNLAKECFHAMLLCEDLISRIQDNVLSDLGCAILFLHAACQGTLLTMSINTKYMTDSDQVDRFQSEGQRIRNMSLAKCNHLLQLVEAKINSMG